MYCAVAVAGNHELSPATATELREIGLDIFHSVQLIVLLIIGVTGGGASGDNFPPIFFSA
jgi:hypothetical protein